MIKNLNNTAFTLLEILLSSVIFLVSVAGIFATLNAVRGPVANKENQLAAAVFGKQVSEALYSTVVYQGQYPYYSPCNPGDGAGTAASPCTDFSLSLGSHQISVATLKTANLQWPSTTLSNANLVNGVPVVTYSVTCADGNGAGYGPPYYCSSQYVAHAISLQINWPQVP